MEAMWADHGAFHAGRETAREFGVDAAFEAAWRTSRDAAVVVLLRAYEAAAARTIDLHARKMLKFRLAWFLHDAGREFFPILQECARLELRMMREQRLGNEPIIVGIISAGGCDACARLDGRHLPWEEAWRTLPIPHPACQNQAGDHSRGFCRCTFVRHVEV